LASFGALTGQKLSEGEAPDSFNMQEAFMGYSSAGRESLVEHALNGTLSLIKGDWKYIEPSKGPSIQVTTNIELGNDPMPQLYNLKHDLKEQTNLAQQHPEVVKQLTDLLQSIREKGRSRP
jgi:arylsulfatase A-like enzyme